MSIEFVQCPDKECDGLLYEDQDDHQIRCNKCNTLWLIEDAR